MFPEIQIKNQKEITTSNSSHSTAAVPKEKKIYNSWLHTTKVKNGQSPLQPLTFTWPIQFKEANIILFSSTHPAQQSQFNSLHRDRLVSLSKRISHCFRAAICHPLPTKAPQGNSSVCGRCHLHTRLGIPSPSQTSLQLAMAK